MTLPVVAIQLPGVELRGDSSVTSYMLDDIEGLTSVPAPRVQSEAREHFHGDYGQAEYWLAAREVRVSGGYGGPDQFAAGDVLKRLVGRVVEVVFVLPHRTFRADVVISSNLLWEPMGIDSADFEFTMRADDPRLYGPLQSFSTGVPARGQGIADALRDPLQEVGGGNPARVALSNVSGTAPSEPVVFIDGGTDGFELLCLETGHVIRCTRPIPDGSFVRVDMSRGVVWIDDQSPLPSTYLPVTEWFQVPAGGTCTIQWRPLGATTGTPRMRVEFSEASW